MSNKQSGGDFSDNSQQFMDDYNRKAFLFNFPPENRWEKVEGVMLQPGPSDGGALVSISGRDHKGEPAQLWVNLPNAMYLLRCSLNARIKQTRLFRPNSRERQNLTHQIDCQGVRPLAWDASAAQPC